MNIRKFENMEVKLLNPLGYVGDRASPVDIVPKDLRCHNMQIDAVTMRAASKTASELLKSLASEHRLLIVCQLIDGERSVGELAEFLGLRASAVSQHLTLLRKDGIVSTRRDGQTIWYSIASEPARQILETLYRLYCSPEPRCGPGGASSQS